MAKKKKPAVQQNDLNYKLKPEGILQSKGTQHQLNYTKNGTNNKKAIIGKNLIAG